MVIARSKEIYREDTLQQRSLRSTAGRNKHQQKQDETCPGHLHDAPEGVRAGRCRLLIGPAKAHSDIGLGVWNRCN